MPAEETFNKVVKITRPTENVDTGTTTDFEVDTEPHESVIFEEYRCRIDESLTYDTSKEGSQFTGKVEMVGKLTKSLQEGDVVDDKYQIMGAPEIRPRQRVTKCNMIRMG